MMKKLSQHPYTVTSIIFLAIIIVGSYFLYWQEEHLAFLLLLYFIVTLGIRLDDISKQLGSSHTRASQISEEEMSITDHLGEIKSSLASIDKTLNNILKTMEQESSEKEKNNEDDNEVFDERNPFS